MEREREVKKLVPEGQNRQRTKEEKLLKRCEFLEEGHSLSYLMVKGYRQISSSVLLMSTEEGVRLARHAVPVPSA